MELPKNDAKHKCEQQIEDEEELSESLDYVKNKIVALSRVKVRYSNQHRWLSQKVTKRKSERQIQASRVFSCKMHWFMSDYLLKWSP